MTIQVIFISIFIYVKCQKANKTVLTITKPVENNGIFMGVMGFDLAMEPFQAIITNVLKKKHNLLKIQ